MTVMRLDRASVPNASPENLVSIDAMVTNNRLLWLQLCAQNPLPTGYFDTPVRGMAIQAAVTGIQAGYIPLFTNKSNNCVGVMVYATFHVAGMQVKLSQNSNLADESVIDYLGSTALAPAFNKRISNTSIVVPNQTVYIASNDVGVVLTDADMFRVLVFDPVRYMNDNTWEAKK